MNETIPILENISTILDLLSSISNLSMIWKVGTHASVTLKLPEEHHRHCHEICNAIKKYGKNFVKKCEYNDEVIVSNIAANKRKNFIHKCHGNCSELIIPIFNGDSYVATIFVGPFRNETDKCAYTGLDELFQKLEPVKAEKLNSLSEITTLLLKDLIPKINPENSKHLVMPNEYFAKYEPIFKSMLFARNNFRRRIKIADVALKCNMSMSNFQHLFKRIVSYSFSEYLQRIRIQEAERLLLYTNLSIGEIAISCYLTDQSRLTKLFKRYYNITPVELRKKSNLKNLSLL